MKTKRISLITLVAIGMALPAVSFASSGYVGTFKSQYPNSAVALQSCALCHTSGSALNNYGSDFAGGQDYVAIEPNDSDGDGFDNITEINGGTMPGDISSKPSSLTSTGAPTTGAAAVSAGATGGATVKKAGKARKTRAAAGNKAGANTQN